VAEGGAPEAYIANELSPLNELRVSLLLSKDTMRI